MYTSCFLSIQTILDLFANETVQHQPTQNTDMNTNKPIAQLAADAIASQSQTQRYVNLLDDAVNNWITDTVMTGKDIAENKKFETVIKIDKESDAPLAEAICFRLGILLRHLGFRDIEVASPVEAEPGAIKVSALLPIPTQKS